MGAKNWKHEIYDNTHTHVPFVYKTDSILLFTQYANYTLWKHQKLQMHPLLKVPLKKKIAVVFYIKKEEEPFFIWKR